VLAGRRFGGTRQSRETGQWGRKGMWGHNPVQVSKPAQQDYDRRLRDLAARCWAEQHADR
jgi:hypothetical protein